MGKDELLEIGAVLIGGLAVFMFLRHSAGAGGATVPAGTPNYGISQSPPSYLNYNLAPPGSGATDSLDAIQPATMTPAAQVQAPCACGSGPVSFAGSGAFADFLTGVNERIVSTYENTIMAAMPEWLGQFINNTFAPDETQAAAGNFAAMAGGNG